VVVFGCLRSALAEATTTRASNPIVRDSTPPPSRTPYQSNTAITHEAAPQAAQRQADRHEASILMQSIMEPPGTPGGSFVSLPLASGAGEIAEDDQAQPLFTTDDGFVEATAKLIASKNLEDA